MSGIRSSFPVVQQEPALAKNSRIALPVRNLPRLTAEENEAIQAPAARVRETCTVKIRRSRANV